jgi:hypothetical protein
LFLAEGACLRHLLSILDDTPASLDAHVTALAIGRRAHSDLHTTAATSQQHPRRHVLLTSISAMPRQPSVFKAAPWTFRADRIQSAPHRLRGRSPEPLVTMHSFSP